MQIQLTWIDPNTQERREPKLETPVAIGRQFSAMPQEHNDERVSRVTISDDLIADYHTLIVWENQELTIIDQNSSHCIRINGVQLTHSILNNGDRLQIGSCEITIGFSAANSSWECDRMIGFLFKRRCGRTDTTHCPHCNPIYEEDYAYYSGYGNYRSGSWGSGYYSNRDRYSYNSETGNVDFTEADAMALEREHDTDYETNMGAS